jgi:alpha,alpha-trehalase
MGSCCDTGTPNNTTDDSAVEQTPSQAADAPAQQPYEAEAKEEKGYGGEEAANANTTTGDYQNNDNGDNGDNNNDDINHILWRGEIFQTVELTRFYVDSKNFVDHVVKKTDEQAIDRDFIRLKLQDLTHHLTSNPLKCLKHLHHAVNSNVDLVNDENDDNITGAVSLLPSKPGSDGSADDNQSPETKKQRQVMQEFMTGNFLEAGSELMVNTPRDYQIQPKSALFASLADLESPDLLNFALKLNELWKLLHREVKAEVSENRGQYSFIPLKHASIYIPGGRFREIYYWDSYWVVRGLLCCNMIESCILIVENMADLVDRFGFVPNGTRHYYRDRSQPPLLTLMADEIYKHTKDKAWIRSILPSLEKEYAYWTSPPVQLEYGTHKLARYYSTDGTPRAESFYEDSIIFDTNDDGDDDNKDNNSNNVSDKVKHDAYHNIRCTAASGWDFSSRWYYDENGPYSMSKPKSTSTSTSSSTDYNESGGGGDSNKPATIVCDHALATDEVQFCHVFAKKRILTLIKEHIIKKLDTSRVIPVDLNTYLCKVETALAKFHDNLGDGETADMYLGRRQTRIQSMIELLWDAEHGQFRDFNVYYKCRGNINMACNFVPLWCPELVSGTNTGNMCDSLIRAFQASQLICKGGIVTTLFETGEQWDWPNCWAPLNHILIEGCRLNGYHPLALQLANTWINQNYFTFCQKEHMHEKYLCWKLGNGGGGEYTPQTGFGWTNGTMLDLMQTFGKDIVLRTIK